MFKKLKIGIDIDNVIADSYPAFLSKFNEFFKTSINYEEIFDFYYLEKHSGIKNDKVKKFIDSLLADEQFQINIPPYKEVQKIISKWNKKGHKIHYITSRPSNTREITFKWLQKYGFILGEFSLDLFNSLQHWDKHREQIKDYKKNIAKTRGVNIFIEDSKEIAETMQMTVLLLDRPWNQGKLPKNVTRVNDWKEIENLVDNIKLLNLLNKRGRGNLVELEKKLLVESDISLNNR